MVSLEGDQSTDQFLSRGSGAKPTSAFLDETHKLQILEGAKQLFKRARAFVNFFLLPARARRPHSTATRQQTAKMGRGRKSWNISNIANRLDAEALLAAPWRCHGVVQPHCFVCNSLDQAVSRHRCHPRNTHDDDADCGLMNS